jgi:hypothetical protein
MIFVFLALVLFGSPAHAAVRTWGAKQAAPVDTPPAQIAPSGWIWSVSDGFKGCGSMAMVFSLAERAPTSAEMASCPSPPRSASAFPATMMEPVNRWAPNWPAGSPCPAFFAAILPKLTPGTVMLATEHTILPDTRVVDLQVFEDPPPAAETIR